MLHVLSLVTLFFSFCYCFYPYCFCFFVSRSLSLLHVVHVIIANWSCYPFFFCCFVP
ncbi:hypothetical protein DFH27DRAFT_568801 [Peziza echinospora]|nr:hypothetical protein DFH27DRAFT_568801 [Peziza echinospora]